MKIVDFNNVKGFKVVKSPKNRTKMNQLIITVHLVNWWTILNNVYILCLLSKYLVWPDFSSQCIKVVNNKYTVVIISLWTKPFHHVKNSQIGQFQMRITQQALFRISCGFFRSTANRYRINKLLINCPILIQNMSKNDAKHNPVFIQLVLLFAS